MGSMWTIGSGAESLLRRLANAWCLHFGQRGEEKKRKEKRKPCKGQSYGELRGPEFSQSSQIRLRYIRLLFRLCFIVISDQLQMG